MSTNCDGICCCRKFELRWGQYFLGSYFFAYLSSFFSQILDLSIEQLLIFMLIYFEWRDTENQQFQLAIYSRRKSHVLCMAFSNSTAFTVFPIKLWAPEKILGMFIVSQPIRCDMKPQKITDKLHHGLVTNWHETMSWFLLPRKIFNVIVFKYWNC